MGGKEGEVANLESLRTTLQKDDIQRDQNGAKV